MGNTYTVEVWVKDPNSDEYYYDSFYRGESFINAIWHMRKAKRMGIGCVTFHWRGVK